MKLTQRRRRPDAPRAAARADGRGRRRWSSNLGAAGDPVELVARFLDLPYLLFLDSATGTTLAAESHQLGRYSFLARRSGAASSAARGSVTELERARPAPAAIEADPLVVVRRSAARRSPRPAVPGLPPFQGGAAGYIGYDYGAVLERLPPRAVRRPGHPRRRARAVRLGHRLGPPAGHRLARSRPGCPETGAARAARARARLAMVRERLRGPARRRRAPDGIGRRRRARAGASPEAPSYPVLGVDGAEAVGLRSTFTHRGYLDAVARVREYIVAGDIFQANLSQRLQAPLVEPPFELYRRLRRRNPAPFAAYLDFGDLPRAERLPRAVSPARRERAPRRDPADQGHPAPRAWARCTTRRSAARWPRATRTGPRT